MHREQLVGDARDVTRAMAHRNGTHPGVGAVEGDEPRGVVDLVGVAHRHRGGAEPARRRAAPHRARGWPGDGRHLSVPAPAAAGGDNGGCHVPAGVSHRVVAVRLVERGQRVGRVQLLLRRRVGTGGERVGGGDVALHRRVRHLTASGAHVADDAE